MSFDIKVSNHYPKNRTAPGVEELISILHGYEILDIKAVKLIDSTHDDRDIRLNYIVDKKYVLRFCNAPDMSEIRLQGLNRLIDRYRNLELECPRFIPHPDGLFLHQWNDLQYYMSEYIDLPLAEEVDIKDWDKLSLEIGESVARFAETYRNVDLIDTMGMYSLFDLSPFDKELGIDEKEQNFNLLIECLNNMQRTDVADKLQKRHQSVRESLREIYQKLPRCVFQGDENGSNILVDSQEHLCGFIDFNMAGTEVIINQLVNLAGFDYDEEKLQPIGAQHRLDNALLYHQNHIEPMLRIYHMNPLEKQSLYLYGWIVMVAAWPTINFFQKCLNDSELSDEIIELLCLIADLPTGL